MASEVFHEVEEADMPKVFTALEANWPKHFVLTQLLTVLNDYKKSGSKWKHSLYVHGDYHNGVYLSKITIELSGCVKVYLYAEATNPDLAVMKKSLLETKLIPWERRNLCFSHINGRYSFCIQSVFVAHGVDFDISPNTMFWLPPNRECKMQPLPENTFIEFLDGSFAQEMDKNWPHKYKGSDLVHKENLEKNFGLGLFRRTDNVLMGSALSNHTGGIFLLFCGPEFRGRGFATILVQHMVQEIRRRGRIPFCTVILGNKPSEHVFRKNGFEAFCDADYLIADGPSSE